MLKWWPEPQPPVYGLGMNVAISPNCLATCLRHEPEQADPVGHAQRLGVGEVELELPVAALVVEAEQAEAEFAHAVGHPVEERHRVQRAHRVVGRGGAQRAAPRHRAQVPAGWPGGGGPSTESAAKA